MLSYQSWPVAQRELLHEERKQVMSFNCSWPFTSGFCTLVGPISFTHWNLTPVFFQTYRSSTIARSTNPLTGHRVGPHRNKCSPAFTLTAVVYVVRKPCDNSYIYTMGWIKSFLFFKLVKFAPMIWVCFSGKFTSVNIIIMKKRRGKKQRKKDLKVRKRELFRDKDPHKRHKNIII